MKERNPETITGQSTSRFAFYPKAAKMLFPEAEYTGLSDHGDVVDHVLNKQGDVLMAQDSVSGTIMANLHVMPDVFANPDLSIYDGVILDVFFGRYAHPDMSDEEISLGVTMQPVEDQCKLNIAKLGLSVAYVTDTGLAPEAIEADGTFTDDDQGIVKQPAYAICTDEAGVACGLEYRGPMSDFKGATRFMAYNNDGYMDPEGDRQILAFRVPHEKAALRKPIRLLRGIQLTGLVQLNNPDKADHADFSVEFEGSADESLRALDLLERGGVTARRLGSLTLKDCRADPDSHEPVDPNVFATTVPGRTSVYIRMNDKEGGLAEELDRLADKIDIKHIEIAGRLESDFSRGLVLEFDSKDVDSATALLNGSAQVLTSPLASSKT